MKTKVTIFLIFCSVILIGGWKDIDIRKVISLPSSELVTEVKWSSDNSKLAALTWSEITIWDTQNWSLIATINDSFVYDIAWQPNGDLIAGVRGGHKESLIVWDANTGTVVHEFDRPTQSNSPEVLVLHAIAWNPDGMEIATDSASYNDIILVWNSSVDKISHSLITSSTTSFHDVLDLEWNKVGDKLLSGGFDGSESTIRVWDAQSGQTLAQVQGFAPIAWGENGESFAGMGLNYVLNIWDVNSETVIKTLSGYTDPLLSISWNTRENLIASIDLSNTVKVWDIDTEVESNLGDFGLANLRSIAWKTNTTTFALGGEGGVVIVDYEE